MNLRRLLVFVLVVSVLGVLLAVSWWMTGFLVLLFAAVPDVPCLFFACLVNLWLPDDEPKGAMRLFGVLSLGGGLGFLALGGGLYLAGHLEWPALMPLVIVAGGSTIAGVAALCLQAKSAE